MDRSTDKRPTVALLAALVVLVVAGVFFWPRTVPNPEPLPPPPPDAAITPVASHTPAAPTSAGATAPITPAPATVPSSAQNLAEIHRTVAENSVPGRMVFLDFVIDAGGLRLTGASGAAGRAKPVAPNTDPGFILFDVFDAGGRLLLTSSVADPTWRRVEFPAAAGGGQIESKIITAESGSGAVRLPGEIAPARIDFYRVKTPRVSPPDARVILGSFSLIPAP